MSSITDYLNKRFPDNVKINSVFRSFTSAKDEFDSLRNGIGLRVNSELMLIQLSGKDVLDFLHRVSSNSLKDLKVLEKRNTLFLNEKGRFIDRTTLISFENDFLLIGNSKNSRQLYSWIDRFIITEDITIKDVSGTFVIVDFIGRQSESFLTLLIGKEINTLDFTTVRRFDVDGFTFYFFVEKEINGIKIYKVLINTEKSVDFIEYLFSIKSVFDLNLVGDDAFDAFRIENKIPVYPNEINNETNPHEVNLIHEVSFTKGCYIGQEVIARLDTYDKVQKRFLQVGLEDPVCPTESYVINDSLDNEVGKITTLSKAELLPEQKGLAIIRKKALEKGALYTIESDNKKVELKFYELPEAK
ncbi:MAG: hypothetical protein NTX65_17155 [Ignavibacteriales bacterium]|nr:hypothetical protein [Ignavibacteriales bacterium]